MNKTDETFGAELYAAIRKIDGYDTITGIFDYHAIQRLKQADHETTIGLFRQSSKEVLQVIKENEPAEIAKFLVEEVRRARRGAGQEANDSMLIVISLI